MKHLFLVSCLALFAVSGNAATKAKKSNSNKPVFTVVKENKITSMVKIVHVDAMIMIITMTMKSTIIMSTITTMTMNIIMSMAKAVHAAVMIMTDIIMQMRYLQAGEEKQPRNIRLMIFRVLWMRLRMTRLTV